MDQEVLVEHLEDIKSEVKQTEELSQDLQDLSKALDKLIYQVENLDENQEEFQEDLSDLDSRVREIREDLARLNPKQLKSQISDLEDDIEKISNKGASVDWQETMEDRVQSLEDQDTVEWEPLIRYAVIIGFFVGLIITMIGWWINLTGASWG